MLSNGLESKTMEWHDLVSLTGFASYNGWEEHSFSYWNYRVMGEAIGEVNYLGRPGLADNDRDQVWMTIYVQPRRHIPETTEQRPYQSSRWRTSPEAVGTFWGKIDVSVELTENYTDIYNADSKQGRVIDYCRDNEIPIYLGEYLAEGWD